MLELAQYGMMDDIWRAGINASSASTEDNMFSVNKRYSVPVVQGHFYEGSRSVNSNVLKTEAFWYLIFNTGTTNVQHHVVSYPIYSGNQLQSTDDLPQDIQDKIGENSYIRYKEFRDYYKDGWGYENGKSLNASSTASFISFLRLCADKDFSTASLFLTVDGNLQLVWEDADNCEIDLEFFPDRIEYYMEKTEKDGVIRIEQCEELVKLIEA